MKFLVASWFFCQDTVDKRSVYVTSFGFTYYHFLSFSKDFSYFLIFFSGNFSYFIDGFYCYISCISISWLGVVILMTLGVFNSLYYKISFSYSSFSAMTSRTLLIGSAVGMNTISALSAAFSLILIYLTTLLMMSI